LVTGVGKLKGGQRGIKKERPRKGRSVGGGARVKQKDGGNWSWKKEKKRLPSEKIEKKRWTCKSVISMNEKKKSKNGKRWEGGSEGKGLSEKKESKKGTLRSVGVYKRRGCGGGGGGVERKDGKVIKKVFHGKSKGPPKTT